VTTYAERLSVPWWAWPATLGGAAFLAAELAIGAMQLRHPLTFVIACALAAAGLAALGRIRIQVGDGGDGDGGDQLRVDDARLPLSVVAAVEVLDAQLRRNLLGLDADPLAFVVQRPWISGGVRIDLDDPTDPTPYWFVSSRHPERLAAAILAAMDPTAPDKPDNPDKTVPSQV
jgi:hypothetical protein